MFQILLERDNKAFNEGFSCQHFKCEHLDGKLERICNDASIIIKIGDQEICRIDKNADPRKEKWTIHDEIALGEAVVGLCSLQEQYGVTLHQQHYKIDTAPSMSEERYSEVKCNESAICICRFTVLNRKIHEMLKCSIIDRDQCCVFVNDYILEYGKQI